MPGMEHFLLILALLIPGFNGQDDKGSTSSSNDNSIAPNTLPDLPNAIHYPIYVPSQYSPSSLITGRLAFDPLSALSSTWMHALSPSMPSVMDWSASSPFLAEVYDEQQLLQQRDMLYQRREELRRKREKLQEQQRQQAHQHPHGQGHQEYENEPMRDRYPDLIQESNPLIPKPVIDEEEEDHRLPAASHDNSRKGTTTSGSESSYIPGDTVFRDRGAAVREIPVSSLQQLHQQRQRILRKESEQGRSPEAIHLHYFSSVRQ